MAFLRNSNGENYKIIGSRPSKIEGRKDYLVQSKGGGVTIAKCWIPEKGYWAHGTFYGWGNEALKKAKIAFTGDELAYLSIFSGEKFGKGKKSKRK